MTENTVAEKKSPEFGYTDEDDTPDSMEFLHGPVNIFVGDSPGVEVRVKTPPDFVYKAPEPFQPPRLAPDKKKYEFGADNEPYGFTDEERRFILELQDTQIATEKFFEGFGRNEDVGTPYTVRELLAKGRRREVHDFIVARYLFNNGIGDEHGELPVVGEVMRYVAKRNGSAVRRESFNYRNLEAYCRENNLGVPATQEILGKASKLFASMPGFY